MFIEIYSEKSFVVRSFGNDTKELKEEFKKLYGKWNPNLQGGPGWIFGNKQMEGVNKLLLLNSNKKRILPNEQPQSISEAPKPL